MLTQYELDKINTERRRKREKELSMSEARRLESQQPAGMDMTSFLIGYTTGIAYDGGSLIGSAMSPVHHTPSYEPSPSCDSGGSSYDSGSSSSDSGGSCGGGSD
jgi:hypothetical protein